MRFWILTLLVAITVAGRVAHAADDLRDAQRATYLRYCGACHGPGGKGDGVAATVMRPKPTDLTGIAKANGGEFPMMRVIEYIDGTKDVRAHGDPQMPVWGEIFRAEAGEHWKAAEVRGRIFFIADYLRSIQEK